MEVGKLFAVEPLPLYQNATEHAPIPAHDRMPDGNP